MDDNKLSNVSNDNKRFATKDLIYKCLTTIASIIFLVVIINNLVQVPQFALKYYIIEIGIGLIMINTFVSIILIFREIRDRIKNRIKLKKNHEI